MIMLLLWLFMLFFVVVIVTAVDFDDVAHVDDGEYGIDGG